MRMNVYICLSAFILSCSVCAGLVPMAVKEMSSVSLPCSHIMDTSMTWTRLVHKEYRFIFSRIGDKEQRDNDPQRRFSSMGYNSLDINRVNPSDTGQYFCNNHPSVELTVIPTGTSIQRAREGTTVTLTCPHVTGSYDPIWKRQSDGWTLNRGLTLTLTNLRPFDSGLFSCDGKPVVYLNVTTGDEEAPSTTTDAKMTSMSATRRPTTEGRPLESTEKKNTSKKKEKKKEKKPGKKDKDKDKDEDEEKDEDKEYENIKTTKTSEVKPTSTTASTASTASTVPPTVSAALLPYPFDLITGISVLCLLLLLLLLFILCLISRRRLKRRTVTESHPVYEEIQDQVEFVAVSGVGSSEVTAVYKKTMTPDAELLDHTYSVITFPSNSSGKAVRVESPYSLIGLPVPHGNNNGLSQLTDTYDRILQ